MRFKNYFEFLLLTAIAAVALWGQMAPQMKIEPQPLIKAKRGAPASVTLKVSLPPGFHANSDKPDDPNLIPLVLKWTGGPLQAGAIAYPKPTMEKYSFTGPKGISVVTGAFEITTKFKVPPAAAAGLAAETGTIRYQACNDRMCFAPKTVPVNVTINVE